MELKKKKIHAKETNASLMTQIVVLEDVNISDVKPDVKNVLAVHGNILMDEVKAMEHQVQLRGRVQFEILYVADLAEYRLSCMRGEVPFREKVGMDDCKQGDPIYVQTQMDDLSVSIVNSRKFSVKALIGLHLMVDDPNEKDIAVDIEAADGMEFCTGIYEMTGLVLRKKDIFRIRDSIKLAEEKEEIGELLWTDVCLQQMEFVPLDEKIQVHGIWRACFLYQTNMGDYEWYEHTDTISSQFPCDGCSDSMLLKVCYNLGNVSTEAVADGDGEMRLIDLDAVVDLDISLFAKESLSLLQDIYGIEKEVDVKNEELYLRNMKENSENRFNVEEKLSVDGEQTIGNVLYANALPCIREQFVTEEGILIKGFINYHVLFRNLTGEDYVTIEKNMPFERKFIYQNGLLTDIPDVQFETEKCSLTVENEKTLEMKLTISAKILVWEEEKIPGITEIFVNDIDSAKQNALPVYAIWVADENDTLWKIGKQFYVPVSRIREVNELTCDELEAGQKLLIVR